MSGLCVISQNEIKIYLMALGANGPLRLQYSNASLPKLWYSLVILSLNAARFHPVTSGRDSRTEEDKDACRPGIIKA